MNKNVINLMLERYNCKTEDDQINVLKEVIQEITLCGLARSDFFEHAAFYGETALRIFFDLDRFSEDLDFSLIKEEPDFDLSKYFYYIEEEAKSYGMDVKIAKAQKSEEKHITNGFLKGNTYELVIKFFPNNVLLNLNRIPRDITVKFEVSTNPVEGANYLVRNRFLPSFHEVKLYDEESLFTGKLAAVICRNCGNRGKGRDFYDYSYYLFRGIKPNMEYLKNKLIQDGKISPKEKFDMKKLKELLYERFDKIDYKSAKEDVMRFVKDNDQINNWSKEYFINLTDEYLK